MNDRELLELAVNALNYPDLKRDQSGFYRILGEHEDGTRCLVRWNPLTNKADCLQMEIDLNFNIARDQVRNKWVIRGHISEQYCLLAEHADRQRASTMAAAELGRVVICQDT